MFIVNPKSKKLRLNGRVVIKKKFVNGTTVLDVGEIGKITEISYENIPDLNLFNIKVLRIQFKDAFISIGESIAEKYVNPI